MLIKLKLYVQMDIYRGKMIKIFFLRELLLLLRESRVRCRVCERVGTVCNPDPELFNSLVRSRPRFELRGIGIWHRPVFLGEKPPEVYGSCRMSPSSRCHCVYEVLR